MIMDMVTYGSSEKIGVERIVEGNVVTTQAVSEYEEHRIVAGDVRGRAAVMPRAASAAYSALMLRYYRFYIPPQKRVCELGCGCGDLLAGVNPSVGMGIDFRPDVLKVARQRHPSLKFCVENAETIGLDPNGIGARGAYDYVIASDLINELLDVQLMLRRVRVVATSETRLVMNFFNNLWRPLVSVAEAFNLKARGGRQNWLDTADVKNLLYLGGWEVISITPRILCPIQLPIITTVLNRYCAPLMRSTCLTIFIVARPCPAALSS